MSTAAPGGANDDLLSSFDVLGDESSILIHGDDTSGMDMDGMGISFHGGVSCTSGGDGMDPVLSDAFTVSGGLGLGEFLKGEVTDGSFGMWDM